MLFASTQEDVHRREALRALIREHFEPHEREIDRRDQADETVLRDLRHRAARMGVIGFNLPEAVGGAGLDYKSQAVVGAETGKVTTVLCEQVGYLPDILRRADDDQRLTVIDPLLRGETTVAYALTEATGGSDLRAANCRASRADDGWVISGEKHFISNAGVADVLLLLAVSDPEAGLRDRFTVFVIPTDTPGLDVTGRYRTMGWRGHHLGALTLEGCRVSDGDVLGEVGQGFELMMSSINGARLNVAARCVGAAERALDVAVGFCLERRIGDGRLADLGVTQQKLADMDVDLHAGAALVEAAAVMGDEHDPDFRIAVARAKLFATEMAGRVADHAIQLLGAAGYSDEYPVERIARDVRGYRIGEGTSEIQRIQIGRNLTRPAR